MVVVLDLKLALLALLALLCLLVCGATTNVRGTDSLPKTEAQQPQHSTQANDHLIHASIKGILPEVKKALSRGADVNTMHPGTGNTALMFASKNGHVEVVDHLLKAKADHGLLNANKHQTALIWACFSGHVNVTRKLLASGAEVDQVNARGDTALTVAAYAGHAHLIPLLYIQGADVHHATTNHSFSALHFAAFKGHNAVVAELLKTDVDIEQGESTGKTALMLAAMEGHEEVVSLLAEQLDSNGLDRMDLQGETALTLAVLFRHERAAIALITAGCNADHVIPKHLAHSLAKPSAHAGDSALHIAVRLRDHGMVRALLLLGVDTQLTDANGLTAAEVALHQGSRDLYAFMLALQEAKL